MSEQGRSNVRWFLVLWLFILSAVSFLDRVNISVAASAIASEYRLSDVQLGWVFSSFLWGYAIFQTFGGWLADKLGPRRVLTAGVVWWGIFTALTAAVSPALTGAVFFFVTVRFLLGAGEAIIYPASNQFVSRWIPTQERGFANGLIFAGVGAGAGSAPAIVTYIMVHYGWRWSFWLSALLGLLVGVVWYLTARDRPEEHPRVLPGELQHIETGITTSVAGVASRDSKANALPWSVILKSKEVWLVTLSYFCFGYVAWIFFSWFHRYLFKVRGLDLKSSAFYSTLPPLAMVACSLLGGVINDRLTKAYGKRIGRCGIAVFALILTAILLVLGSQAASAQLASMVLAGGAGALYLAQSSYWSVTADIAGARAGSTSGFMNMGAQLGGGVTAILTPVIASHLGWTYPFLFAAVLSAVGALAWLAVNPQRTLERVAQASS
ncbi:MAG TPA: MFS transporter [Candidatus Acidoferrales bacterium]|jgi:ACS family glucarate transporter-like MFS transporter|nr:MFS transporter [Candidatus Acidoferrales bacterium]